MSKPKPKAPKNTWGDKATCTLGIYGPSEDGAELAWFAALAENRISISVEKRPNWFHRLIQRWLLGVRWYRVSDYCDQEEDSP